MKLKVAFLSTLVSGIVFQAVCQKIPEGYKVVYEQSRPAWTRFERRHHQVFFDGTLIEEAKDGTVGPGFIGFGSLGDSAKIDNVKIRAQNAEVKRIEFF